MNRYILTVVAWSMLMSIAIGQTIIDYRGLEIQSPDPTGAAGLRLQNNFKALADRIGPANLTATAAPTVDDDVDEGYYVGSLWYDAVGSVLYWCADNTDGAAVWKDLSTAGGAAAISDAAYAASWDGVTTVAPSKNAVYDYLSGLSSVYQAADADLTTWAGVTSSANGRSLVSAADYAAMKTLLAYGTMANQNANAVAITGGTIDNTTIGGTTAGAGTFRTLQANATYVDANSPGVKIVSGTSHGIGWYDTAGTSTNRNWLIGNRIQANGTFSLQRSTAQGQAPTTVVMAWDRDGKTGVKENSPDYLFDVNGTFGFTPGIDVEPIDNGDVTIDFPTATTLRLRGKNSDTVRHLTLPITDAALTDGYVLKVASGTPTWAADTDTNYSAGNGLSLTGTTFSTKLKSGGGLEIDNEELTLTSTHLTGEIGIIIDGAGSEIADGVKGFVRVPYACTITGVYLMADQTGSIVVDVWKEAFASYPPDDGNSITASAPPTLSSAASGSDTTLTGWTKSISAGDVIGFNVDSCTTIERLTLQITTTK